MTPEQLLEQAISHFSRWRSSRLHKTEKTPHALKLRAVDLLNHYRKSQICEILNLRPGALSQWQEECTESSSSSFVQLPAIIKEEETSEHPQEYLKLKLCLTSGESIELSGSFSPEFVLALIKGLKA